MGNQNSHVENTILGLYRKMCYDLYDQLSPCLPEDLPARKSLSREAERDIAYIERRTIAEGIEFLTRNLPRLGETLDQILAGEEVEFPLGFAPYTEFGYPCLFRMIWAKVLDIVACCNDVPLAPDVGNSTARLIRVFRTVLYGVKKLEIPFTKAQEAERLHAFLDCEEEVRSFMLPANNRVTETAEHVAALVLDGFHRNSSEEAYLDLRPKHGPGAVATGEKYDQKWTFSHLYQTLHSRFPYYCYMYGIRSNGRAIHLASLAKDYRHMLKCDYPVAKLVFVPKDSRGPRIISSEPLELQYMQQAYAIPLVRFLEQKSWCRGQINFTDQEVNRSLALTSSETREFCTLDLSEASDRVSQTLVTRILPEFYPGSSRSLHRDILALRSHATSYRGVEIKLEKFAPMGSALCFPIESVIFYCLCVAALREEGESLDSARRSVFVYGDDIIVPTRYRCAVEEALSQHGLLVNGKKSFSTGYFRESCGCDAWHGHDVTPVRIRKLPGRKPSSGLSHTAWLAYASHFFSSQMDRSGMYCKELVETVLRRSIPFTSADFGYLSVLKPRHIDDVNDYHDVKWSESTCHCSAKVFVLKNKTTTSLLDGEKRLLRNLLSYGRDRDPNEVVVRDATKMARVRKTLLWS